MSRTRASSPGRPGASWRRVLLAITAATLALAFGCSSPEEEIAMHLERGQDYAARGFHREAAIEYRSALRIDPKRADVHFGLAEAYRALGRADDAFWELQQTVRLDPAHHTAKVYYAQTLSLSSQDSVREEALKLAREATAARPDDVPAKLAEGRALRALGRIEEARDAFAAAVAIDASHAEAWRLRAWASNALGDADAAEAAYRSAAAADGSFISWVSLAQHIAGQEDRDDEAIATYREAIAAGDEDEAARGVEGLAGFLFSRGRVADAEVELTRGYEESRHPALLRLLARFHARMGSPEKAESLVREAAEESEDDPAPHVTLSAYLADRGDLDAASAAIQRALEIDPSDPNARLREVYLIAEIGRRDGDEAEVARARRLLDEIILGAPSNLGRAYIVRGQMELAAGDAKAAVDSIRGAIDLGVDSASAHMLHGAALLSSEPLRATEALRRALERDPSSFEAAALLVEAYNRTGNAEAALTVGGPLLVTEPGRAALRLAIVESLTKLERAEEASQLAARAPVQTVELVVARARLDVRRGEPEAAREALDAVTGPERDDPRLLAVQLDLDASEGRLEESAARLAAAMQANPGEGQIVWLHGRLLARQGSVTEAREELRRAIELSPDHLAAYLDLAALLAREGQLADVVATYEEAAARRPNASLELLLGLIYEQNSRIDQAVEHYQRSVEIDPTLGIAKNNLAFLLADQKKELDRALELAQSAKRQLPRDPGIADTLGWVYFQRGSFGSAVAYLREAEAGYPEDDPTRNVIRYHLALAEEANGELRAAAKTIGAALSSLERARANGQNASPEWADTARSLAKRLGGV